VVATKGFRRRATAIAERCFPTIIREADYEQLEELIAVIRWFGIPEAVELDAPEDYAKVPGLSLEEAIALVRLRMKRSEPYAPFYYLKPETPPPAPSAAEPVAPAAPVPSVAETAEPAGAATPVPAQAPVEPRGAAFPAKAELPGPQTLYRVFRNGRMWFMDPKTKKIVSEAPF
jgi:hypothetical protein